MDSMNSTIDLDQSSVLSSTKNDESISSEDLNGSDLVEEASGNYITSVQSPSQLSTAAIKSQPSGTDSGQLDQSNSSSSSSERLSSSDTFRDNNTLAAELSAELSQHPMRLPEVTLEAEGEKSDEEEEEEAEETAPPLVEVRDELLQEEDRDVEEIQMSLPAATAVPNGPSGLVSPQEDSKDDPSSPVATSAVSPPVAFGGIAASDSTAAVEINRTAAGSSSAAVGSDGTAAGSSTSTAAVMGVGTAAASISTAAAVGAAGTAALLRDANKKDPVAGPASNPDKKPAEKVPAQLMETSSTKENKQISEVEKEEKATPLKGQDASQPGESGDLATEEPTGRSSSPKKRQFDQFVEGSNLEEDEKELSSGELTDVEDNLEAPLLLGFEQQPQSQQATGVPVSEGLPAKKARVLEPTLPSTVQVLTSETSGARVYLVGTAHFSKESCEDVSLVIQAVQPDIVMVELCKQRTNILHLDEETVLQEAQNLTLERSLDIIKQQGAVQGVMYLLLLSMSAHLTKELGMAPGGEFRRAYTEAQKVPGCILHLGDRPIGITLKRALSGLSWWQKLRLGFNILTSKDTITKEEVEKCKQRDLLENMLAEMAGEFPALSRVFVAERDQFLAHSLQIAANSIPLRPAARGPGSLADLSGPAPVVVGIVGIGHVPGILKNWGKVTKDDIREIVKIDPPSRTARAIKLAIKLTFIGGCVYGLYRVTRGPVTRILLTK